MTTTMQATGTIATNSWDEEVYAPIERAPKLSLDRIRHAFSGDIEGVGTARFLNAYRGESAATFAGFERVTGSLGGRAGSFVL